MHRSRDGLIFNMGIPVLVRRHLYIETTHWLSRGFPFCVEILWIELSKPFSPDQYIYIYIYIYITRYPWQIQDIIEIFNLKWQFGSIKMEANNLKSPLVQVMAWCRNVTSHRLSPCWPRSRSPYGVIRSQWISSPSLPTSILLNTRNVNS